MTSTKDNPAGTFNLGVASPRCPDEVLASTVVTTARAKVLFPLGNFVLLEVRGRSDGAGDGVGPGDDEGGDVGFAVAKTELKLVRLDDRVELVGCPGEASSWGVMWCYWSIFFRSVDGSMCEKN